MADEVAAAADSAKAQAEAEARASQAGEAEVAEAGEETEAEATHGQAAEPAELAPPSTPGAPTTPGRPAPVGAEGDAAGAEADGPIVLTPMPSRLEEAADKGAASEAPTPHGAGCLHEVLRFLVLLCDPNDAQNPQAVREFGLSLLHVALQAGGPALAGVPALSALLANDLALALIMNAEASGGNGGASGAGNGGGGSDVDEGSVPAHELLSLVLMCVYQLFLVLGVQGTLQEEALLHRIYLKLLNNKTLMEAREHRDQREMVFEMLLQLCELPQLPLELYTHFDCDKRRTDMLDDLAKALSRAAFPVGGPPDAGHLLSVEALLAIVRATCAVPPAPEPPGAEPPSGETATGAAAAAEPSAQLVAAAAQLRQNKASKRAVAKIAEAFNTKPKHGIKALEESGLLSVPLVPAELATFLRETVQLDKAVLGDYLSDPAEFNAAVLKIFVSLQDFAALTIDGALRIFLQSFRLPGEAQKIDRLMEAFAAAYFTGNPGSFENADGAYVLAFSIIMLNTDRHSPNITKRMTVEDFVRNNRGINNGNNLPDEMLHAVFKEISENEIKMLGGKEELALSASGWRHIVAQSAVQASWSGVAPPPELSTAFGTGLELELLHTLWQPTLAALSALIEASNDRAVLGRALQGFAVCSRVAAQCIATDVLDALVAQLARLSTLLAPLPATGVPRLGEPLPPSPSERPFATQPKAMMAAAALCRVAREHGHALRGGWEPVVQVVVGLHDRRLLPPSLADDGGFLAPGGGSGSGSGSGGGGGGGGSGGSGGSGGGEDAAAPTPPSVAAQKSKSNTFSFFGGLAYLIGAGTDAEADEARLRAEEEARKEVAGFGVAELFEETAFLPPEALAALTDTLLNAAFSTPATSKEPAAAAGAAAVDAAAGEPPTSPRLLATAGSGMTPAATTPGRTSPEPGAREVRRPVLLMQLLVEVALRNRDRFDVLWPRMHARFAGAFEAHATRPALVQPAAVALLRLCVRLAHRDGLLDGVLPALEPALDVELDGLPRKLFAEQTSAGVLLLLQSGAAPHICRARSWRVLLGLASGPSVATSVTASECGAEALGVVVRAPACVTAANFASLLDALLWHGGCEVATAASCTQAVDLLFALHTRLHALAPALVDGSPRSNQQLLNEFAVAVRGHAPPLGSASHERVWGGLAPAAAAPAAAPAAEAEVVAASPEATWLQLWLPVLRALCLLCFDSRAAVRDAAVVTLQRALLDTELRALPAATWGKTIDEVVFPFLAELLARSTPRDGLRDEGLMRRAITLMSKAFLQHLEPLLSLPHFQRLWLRALELLEQYMRSPDNELLQEAVPETLKNMLLVMGASGAFNAGATAGAGGQSFLELTRAVINDFCEPMQKAAELAFASLQPPEPEPEPAPEPAQPAPPPEPLPAEASSAEPGAPPIPTAPQAASTAEAADDAKPAPETPPPSTSSSWFGYFSG